MLADMDAVLVPGGFGKRGVEGKYWQHNMPVKIRYLI